MSWKPDSKDAGDKIEMKWTQKKHPLKADASNLKVDSSMQITQRGSVLANKQTIMDWGFKGLFKNANDQSFLRCDSYDHYFSVGLRKESTNDVAAGKYALPDTLGTQNMKGKDSR